MAGRGNNRGRGTRGRGGNFKFSQRSESIHDRLGNKAPIYPKSAQLTSKRYKFVKTPAVTSTIGLLPAEPRIRLLSKKFLKTYYDIFDQPGRANLESQYNADAFFSFSATCPMPSVGRNLLEVLEPEQRINLLVHNKTNIANALATFSPTEHSINLLSTDVPFIIANTMNVISMQIVVSGVFKDTSQTTNSLRAFTRVFVLKLVSIDKQGEPVYEIFNDLFMLQSPTPDQIKRYHQESLVKKSQSQQNSSTTDDYSKSRESMIQSIMAKTRMNKKGAQRLLEDSEWDEVKSLEIFNHVYHTNQVPQEFFTP